MLKIGKEAWEKVGIKEQTWNKFEKEKQKAILECSKNGHNLKNYLNFNDDIDVVLIAVQNEMLANGKETALSFASDRLKNDEKVVFEAIKHAGLTLASASERFKNNEKYIELAVLEEPAAINCASNEKQNDITFLRRLSQKHPRIVKYIKNKEIRNNLKNEAKKVSKSR